MVYAKQGAHLQQIGRTISLRCPSCRQLGTLMAAPGGQDIYCSDGVNQHLCGCRLCPNDLCKALIFVVWDGPNNTLVTSYPPERLDFDSTNIPAGITNALEEAITCVSNECYVAGAIMVRKTLEELCHERAAAGVNLKERLRSLGNKALLPKELLDGLDDLRLLGNDAAHIESQEFNQIGKEEVEIGVHFAKEVLKAVFQYSDLLAKLRSLRRSP